ncbi:uncharacterized protein LOC110456142 [Mizuhopecten yessoensis]|uniref:uncharacterized protein LOC110456142 n=1 Tax=Mizuhopecten yessoensis TaxID=6573 RepID=UPI000B45DD46|nr:uncharacterized protein LOC110456142 [Mizuhopecten yessoensis]
MMSSVLFMLLVVMMASVHVQGCNCPDLEKKDPWCGDEGDYDSLCELQCKDDEIVGHDTCDKIEKCEDALPLDQGPDVCAEYGITFDSLEEMKCHNLEFVSKGECP